MTLKINGNKNLRGTIYSKSKMHFENHFTSKYIGYGKNITFYPQKFKKRYRGNTSQIL